MDLHKKTDAEGTKSTELEKKVTQIEKMIADLQEKLEKSGSDAVVLRREMSEIKTDLEKLKENIKDKDTCRQTQLNEFIADSSDLLRHNRELKHDLEQLHQKTDAERTKSMELEKKVKQKEKIIADLKENLKKSGSDAVVLRSQMSELQNDLEKLHIKTDAEEFSSTEKLHQKVKEKERMIAGLQENLEKSVSEAVVLRRQMSELKKELEKNHLAIWCCVAVVIGYVVVRCVSNLMFV